MLSRFSRSRTAPTGYEKVRLLFHAVRFFQLVASLVVSTIVFYFVWWLVHDNYPVYWTFIILTISSTCTVACLGVTIALHFLTGLNPKLNLLLNSAMLSIWALGWALLFRWTIGVLSVSCTSWLHRPGGIDVCRLYKTLFSFALLGLLSTAAALVLDMHIYKLAVRFGKHMRLDNDAAAQKRRVVDARLHVDDEGRRSEAFEIPERFGTRYDLGSEKVARGESYGFTEYGHDTTYRAYDGDARGR